MIGGAIILVSGIMEEKTIDGKSQTVLNLLEEQMPNQEETVKYIKHFIDYVNKNPNAKLVNSILDLKEGQLFSSDYKQKNIANF